jgi:hypothetical protein
MKRFKDHMLFPLSNPAALSGFFGVFGVFWSLGLLLGLLLFWRLDESLGFLGGKEVRLPPKPAFGPFPKIGREISALPERSELSQIWTSIRCGEHLKFIARHSPLAGSKVRAVLSRGYFYSACVCHLTCVFRPQSPEKRVSGTVVPFLPARSRAAANSFARILGGKISHTMVHLHSLFTLPVCLYRFSRDAGELVGALNGGTFFGRVDKRGSVL